MVPNSAEGRGEGGGSLTPCGEVQPSCSLWCFAVPGGHPALPARLSERKGRRKFCATSALLQASDLSQTLHPSQAHAVPKQLPRAHTTTKSFLSSHLNPVNIYIYAIPKRRKPQHATFKSRNPQTPPLAKISAQGDPESAGIRSRFRDRSAMEATPSPHGARGTAEPVFNISGKDPEYGSRDSESPALPVTTARAGGGCSSEHPPGCRGAAPPKAPPPHGPAPPTHLLLTQPAVGGLQVRQVGERLNPLHGEGGGGRAAALPRRRPRARRRGRRHLGIQLTRFPPPSGPPELPVAVPEHLQSLGSA